MSISLFLLGFIFCYKSGFVSLLMTLSFLLIVYGLEHTVFKNDEEGYKYLRDNFDKIWKPSTIGQIVYIVFDMVIVPLGL